MTLGVVILAHERPEVVGPVARSLAAQGAQVVVHLDRRARRRGWAEAVAPACLISSRATDWGTMGLVDAALDALRMLLALPGLSHVCLLSGACLPLRSVEELTAFLSDHRGADFIEARTPGAGWPLGGLGLERVTLRHPFPWKRRRWLFDRSVAVQRRLGLARALPDGLDLRFGSQWWCLSVPSLRAILSDPDLPALRRLFRRAWIPDESFLQTLAARHGRIAGGPLTFARFDPDGEPVVLHDDHAEMLGWSDFFFARKVSPHAHDLRGRFLAGRGLGHAEFRGQIDDLDLTDAFAEGKAGHRGLLTPGRYPRKTAPGRVETARPYGVLVAEDAAALDRICRELAAEAAAAPAEAVGMAIGMGRSLATRPGPREAAMPPGLSVHGRLFAPDAAAAGSLLPGNLPSDPALRDYRPEQRLARLIYAERAHGTVFALKPSEAPGLTRSVLADPNARVFVLGDGAVAEALRRAHGQVSAQVLATGPNLAGQGWRRRLRNRLSSMGQDI